MKKQQMCDNNGDTFITIFHNVRLALDLCDRLFSIITSMNLGNTCLFHKWFFTVYFGEKEKNTVTLPHIVQREHEVWGEIKKTSKIKKLPSRKNITLEFLHQILGQKSTRLLLAGDTANVWEGIEL